MGFNLEEGTGADAVGSGAQDGGCHKDAAIRLSCWTKAGLRQVDHHWLTPVPGKLQQLVV